MNSKKNFWYLMTVSALIISVLVMSGGCGGSSSSSSGGGRHDVRVKLAYDGDGDGVPDVFDKFPQDAANYAYDVTRDSGGATGTVAVPHTFIGFLDKLVVISQDIERESDDGSVYVETVSIQTEDVRSYNVQLFGGKPYSIVFYDLKKKGNRSMGYPLDVIITDSEGNTVEHDLHIETPEDISAVVMPFVPKSDGVYNIKIKNPMYMLQTDRVNFTFDITEDSTRGGMPLVFSASDGLEYSYSFKDILFLASQIAVHTDEGGYDTNGMPVRFGAAAKEAFEKGLMYANSVYAVPQGASGDLVEASDAVAHRTRLEPVASIKWGKDFRLGSGYYADTGMEADRVGIMNFQIPSSAGRITSNRDTTRVQFISSELEHEQQLKIGGALTFAMAILSFQANTEYNESIKYSEKSTTMILNYEKMESTPRVLDRTEYKMTNMAKSYVDTPDDFREDYGDYFIAGARYGASYNAAVTIKANSSEKIRDVKSKLGGMVFIKGASADINTEFAKMFKDVTNGLEVRIERVRVYGQTTPQRAQDGEGNPSTIDDLLADMKDFIKKAEDPKFMAPMEAYMMRYIQIPDGDPLPTRVNIDPETFSRVRAMSRTYLSLTAQNDMLSSIPDNDLRSGTKSKYKEEYNSVITAYSSNIGAICEDLKKVDQQIQKMSVLKKSFQDLIDRHSFFLKLNEVGKALPTRLVGEFVEKGGYTKQFGFINGYSGSTIVNNDIDKYDIDDSNLKYKEEWGSHWNRWKPDWEMTGDRRIVGFTINVNHTQNFTDDRNHPPLGAKWLKLSFEGEYSRSANWSVYPRALHLGPNSDNYPFTWGSN